MKILLSCCLFIFISCQTTTVKEPKLEGLWCNSFNHCVYFKDTVCLLHRSNFQPYQLQADTLQVIYNQEILKHAIDIQGDTLFIDNSKYVVRYIRQHQLHDIEMEQMTYSVSFDDYYNGILYNNGLLELDIKYLLYDTIITSGFYSDTLNNHKLDYFKALLQTMPLEVSNELNQGIISDIPEWSIMIKGTDSSSYKLHYNYANLQKTHKYFETALIFKLFQASSLVKSPKKDTLVRQFEAIQAFRESEFDRNLKLYHNEYK